MAILKRCSGRVRPVSQVGGVSAVSGKKSTTLSGRQLFLTAILTVLVFSTTADAARVKDISTLSGMRSNQLIGYGLVVGLKNTGDRSYNSPFTIQTLLSMLKRLGTTVDIRQLTGRNIGVSETRYLRDVRVENIAAVMVTANLPPFAKPGHKIDISVSSLGDARSLKDGTLLMTPLKAADGKVYAVAQGTLPATGDSKRRGGRARNSANVGVIPNGGLVEKGVDSNFASKKKFRFLLKSPDFTTAKTVVVAINRSFGENTAKGIDAGTIEILLPGKYSGDPLGFISEVELLEVQKDSIAKVVLDEKTGTVVIGEFVEVNNVAVSIGDITLQVRRRSAPLPAGKEKLNVVAKNADIKELVTALNALGISPRDMAAIFRSLRAAGALNADLEIL